MSAFEHRRPEGAASLSEAQLLKWFHDFLCQRLGTPPEGYSQLTPFSSMGLDSMDAVIMAGHLEEAMGRTVDPEIFLTRRCLGEVMDTLQQRGFLVRGV